MGTSTVKIPHGACFFCLEMMRPVSAKITEYQVSIHAVCDACPPMPAKFIYLYRPTDQQAIGQLWELGWWLVVELRVKRLFGRFRRAYRAFLETACV